MLIHYFIILCAVFLFLFFFFSFFNLQALSNQEIVQHDLSPRFLSQPQSGHHENATSKAITSYESGDDVSTSCHTGSGDTSGCLYDAVSNAVSAASNRLVCVSDPIGIRRPQRKRRKARKSFLLDGRHPEDNGEDEDDEDDDFEYEDDSDGFKLTSRHTGKTVSPSRALRYSEDSGFQSDNSRRKPPDLPASHRQQESQLDPPQSHRPALSRDADSALTSKPVSTHNRTFTLVSPCPTISLPVLTAGVVLVLVLALILHICFEKINPLFCCSSCCRSRIQLRSKNTFVFCDQRDSL